VSYVFVDRILECTPGESVTALKALSFNEELFRDHFPGMPVLPGAMILEGFVQASRHCLDLGEGEGGAWILDAVEAMRFNRFARPGDLLRLEASVDKREGGRIWFKGRARVGEEGVCRLRFAVRRREASGD